MVGGHLVSLHIDFVVLQCMANGVFSSVGMVASSVHAPSRLYLASTDSRQSDTLDARQNSPRLANGAESVTRTMKDAVPPKEYDRQIRTRLARLQEGLNCNVLS